jgi:ABC-type multidrug transport system ATPase subunit
VGVGNRTEEIRKVYTPLPPAAAGAAGFSFTACRSRGPASKGAAGKNARKPEIVALDGISLAVQPGEIFGLLGPNGAGKSTTVGVLTTRVRPTGGPAWIGPHEVWKD